MELCEHGDLGKYLETNKTLSESYTRQLAGQLLEGLVVMHGYGITHRDLKPGVSSP